MTAQIARATCEHSDDVWCAKCFPRMHIASVPLPFTLTDDEPADDFRRFWVGLFVGVVLGSAVQVALLAWAVSL